MKEWLHYKSGEWRWNIEGFNVEDMSESLQK